jgi:hypothetical protein
MFGVASDVAVGAGVFAESSGPAHLPDDDQHGQLDGNDGVIRAQPHRRAAGLTQIETGRRQVLMSRNISGGPPISVFMGGLNYQIEHHLFPSMARPQLHKAQPLVAAYCAAQGVPCTRTTLWQSCADARDPCPKRYLAATGSWTTVGLAVAHYRIVIGYLNTVGLRGKDPFMCPLIAQRRAF